MRIIGIVGLFAMALAGLSAQDRAGNQIFQIPAGWSRTDLPGGSTVLSPDAEPKNMAVLVLSGHPLNGDFRATFDRDVQTINGSLKVLDAGEVQSRRSPEGVDFLATTVALQAPSRARLVRYFMAANARGRFEILIYMAVNPVLFRRYWPAVRQFAATWSFANLSAATAPPAEPVPAAPVEQASPNQLDGVYSGYKYIYSTVLGVVQKKAVTDFFSFFPDGRVYWGLPQTGLAGFNMAQACEGGKVDFCGTYQKSGDQVVIVLNRGTYRQVGMIAPGGLQIGDRMYTLQGDISKSAARVLEGDFGRADARPGEDLARRFIRFTRDGKFMDQGIVTTVTSSDFSSGKLRFEREAGSGTYSLAPYTLILRYSDGYRRQLGVIVKPSDMDKPALSEIFVNTYTLVRRR